MRACAQVACYAAPIKTPVGRTRQARRVDSLGIKTYDDDGKDGWMSHANSDAFRLGFLAAIEDVERGFVGGLLVTNRFGRPLEFQCTAPVKPNRAQQILYGPTLRPFVLSELIGRTLLDKIGVKPQLVLIESNEILDLRQHVPMPVAFLSQADTSDETAIRCGKLALGMHADYPADRTEIERYAKLIPAEATLSEPFERVHEALQETLRLGTARSA